jgi:hypothetical protein
MVPRPALPCADLKKGEPPFTASAGFLAITMSRCIDADVSLCRLPSRLLHQVLTPQFIADAQTLSSQPNSHCNTRRPQIRSATPLT